MSGRPPLLRQDECLALLRGPDERREYVLAGLLATTPVGTVTTSLAGQRHPVDPPWLRARGHGEASFWHRPDLGPLDTPERETSMYTTVYTQLDHRSPPVVRAPGCCYTAGAFLHPRPSLAARPGGEKSAGRKGAQGWGPQKSQSTVVTADWRVFGVPWRSRVPVLDCCPFARPPGSLLKGHKGIETDSASNPGAAPT